MPKRWSARVPAGKRLALAAAVAGFASAGTAPAATPYNVDAMFAVEAFGTVRFDPTGGKLLFERHGPFDRQASFGRQAVAGQLRSKVYVIDLGESGPPRLLFEQDPGEGYRIDAIAPDGGHVAFSNVSAEGLQAGLVRLADRAVTQFEGPAAYNPETSPPWLGGGRFVREMLAPGEVDLLVGLETESLERTAALWRQRNEGRVATSQRIGSGRFATRSGGRGALAVLGPDGAARPFAPGAWTSTHLSAGGEALAALRETPLLIDPEAALEHGANIGGVQRGLLVFRVGRDGPAGEPARPCDGCDVLASSINWSAAAPLLSFVARDEAAGWDEPEYHVYDHRTGTSREVAIPGLEPEIGRAGLRLDIQTAWLGDRLVLHTRPAGAAETEARADWHLTGPVPINLTAGFEGETPQLLGLTGDALLFLHGGDVWRVDAAGRRANLTEAIVEPVLAWREPTVYSNLPYVDRRPAAHVTVQIPSESRGSPDRLLIVDAESGRVDTIAAPSHESQFVAVHPERRLAAVIDRPGTATTLWVVSADGSRREVLTLNRHLADVAGGTPVRIDHEGPAGDRRMSWLLLPPGYREGDRVPTVVNLYPGWIGRESWTRWRVDQVAALNDHVLAGAGYAVLYPSLPVRYEQVPRDPLEGLVADVDAAVDAAIAMGFVDPERVAVQGQSLGGYATGAIIGLTDRFRTAVAQAGLYDLVSSYGQFDIRQRHDHDERGLDLFGASILETSQGGMGAPPWEDAERYLRNSPLMHVPEIDTPILIMTGDRDIVSTTQAEEYFTALTRLGKDAVMLRYYGEGHIYNSAANIRDLWERVISWYRETLGEPYRPGGE